METLTTRLDRRAFSRLLAGAPLLGHALGPSRVAAQSADNATVALFRGDAAQSGQMPGPAPSAAPEQLWLVPGLVGRSYAPMVAGDLVIGVAEDEELVALDTATGEERWRFNRGRRLQLTAIPSAADGLLYINGRAAEGDRLATLFALDLATGEEVWRLTLPDAERMHEWTCPLVADGIVYLAATTGYAFALDAATGEEIWRVEVGNATFPPPALADGRLVFLHADGFLALDAATGEELWREGIPGSGLSVSVADGLVLAVADQFGGPLHALDLETSQERWVFTGDEGMNAHQPVAVANGTVYAASFSTLFALDLETGEVRWQRDDGTPGSPTIVGDQLYVQFADDLFALDAASGDDIWTVEDWLGDNYEVHSPMVIADGRIFIYAGEGLLAFGAPEDAS